MKQNDFFRYGDTETEYLKRRDKRLAEVIEKVGKIQRAVIPDLFAALVHSIVGQQISTRAHETIWARMKQGLQEITPQAIDRMPEEELQRFGISFRKAAYIKSAAKKIVSGEFDLQALETLPDEAVCAKLTELEGVGVWTAEMLMIFSMQRPDVFSFQDLAIIRGLRMTYRHRSIDRAKFDRYRKRYSPYASVASLYLWAVASGAVNGMEDRKPLKDNRRKKKKNREPAGRKPSDTPERTFHKGYPEHNDLKTKA